MKAFSMLLDGLIAAPKEQRHVIEQLIRNTFAKKKAVLALDMSDFTLSVRREGILPYLCQIRRMHRITLPIVRSHQGELIKYEADNLLAVFDDPRQAVEAAIAAHQAAKESSRDGPPLAFSIGIDYGELLLVADSDCFGDPVNLAYKLGEDIAQAGEILITSGVKEQVGDVPHFQLREMRFSIAGVELSAYSVLYDLAEPGATPDTGRT